MRCRGKGNFPPQNLGTFVKRNDVKKYGVTCELTGKSKRRDPPQKTREGDDTNEAKPLSKHRELGTQKQHRDIAP